MFEIIKEHVKTIFIIVLIIIANHGLFFIAYGYCMSGNPFIALRNFYHIMYNIG